MHIHTPQRTSCRACKYIIIKAHCTTQDCAKSDTASLPIHHSALLNTIMLTGVHKEREEGHPGITLTPMNFEFTNIPCFFGAAKKDMFFSPSPPALVLPHLSICLHPSPPPALSSPSTLVVPSPQHLSPSLPPPPQHLAPLQHLLSPHLSICLPPSLPPPPQHLAPPSTLVVPSPQHLSPSLPPPALFFPPQHLLSPPQH